jgi:hypothetical protein
VEIVHGALRAAGGRERPCPENNVAPVDRRSCRAMTGSAAGRPDVLNTLFLPFEVQDARKHSGDNVLVAPKPVDLCAFDDRLLNGLGFSVGKVYDLFEQVRNEPDGITKLRLRPTKNEKRLIVALLTIGASL